MGRRLAQATARQRYKHEFTLEKVKVVHNDLTDAEVEVVPMKSRPAREPALSETGR